MTAQGTNIGSEKASTAHEKPLRESLDDASVLLWYATREGKNVSDQTVQHIVRAQSVLNSEARDPVVESLFWAAFRDLATAVQPVSVDSILATYSYPFGEQSRNAKHPGSWLAWWPWLPGRRRLVDAATTKKKYSFLAVVVLVCLLAVQIYWFIGTTFRTDLENHRAELDKIAGSLREMTPGVHASASILAIKENQLQGDRGTKRVDQLEEEIKSLRDSHSKLMLTYANVTRRGSRVLIMLRGDSTMLDWWDFFTEFAGLSEDAKGIEGLPSADQNVGISTPPYRSNGLEVANYVNFLQNLDQEQDIQEFQDRIINIENALVNDQLKVEVALLNSKSTLAILSQYVLPLLYGLLGALAYILRTLSREIQNVTFTRGSEIRYSLRWPLGMLGGVTVGLFFDPADLSGFAVITPLGLAFLAGYGVELLFTGLDRIVGAFTGEGTERSRTA
jgi:hypothetical protein